MLKKVNLHAVVAAMALANCTAQAAPQAPPNYGCPGPEYQQFAFWVGDWDVISAANGQVAGLSHVERLAAGCIIFEKWTGAKGGSGNSINVYDQADGKWHQTWVDSTGDQVHYVGTWTGSKLDLEADDVSTPQKVPVVLTMTFEPLPNGDVRQSGTQSSDGGKTFLPSFDLIYKKKKP
jgi:hypothetical protein